ncbi:MAG: two-component sensor histidine kinase, partial [Deltaproteobacteria bacterium]|nr:two-component sensor histidine kinase [Deltaproteobacteria bacterium]
MKDKEPLQDNDRRYYRLLTRNIVMTVVAVAVAPLILTGVLLTNQYRGAYQEKVFHQLDELVQKHSQNIDSFLTDRLADIRVLARSYSLAQMADQSFLRRRLAILREEYGGVFVDLGLVDSQGVQQAYAGPFNLAQADYAQAEWFKQARLSEHFISDVFTGLRGTPHFIVAVRQAEGGRDWLLRATIDFEAFNALVENIRIGQTGFAFILNRSGDFQTKPSYAVNLDQGPYKDLLEGRIEVGREAIVAEAYLSGRKSILALAPLKGGEWVLCCQQDWNDAFALISRAERLAAIIFFIGGAAILVVAFLLTRRLVRRIAKADREKSVMNETVVEAGRLASIGELAAGIAHEINNPVAIMVEEAGWVEDLLADEDPTTEENLAELRRAVGQIQTQGGRCKEITHKLLSFARKTDPTIQQVSLNGLVKDVISLLGQKARYANVEIKADLAPALPPVAASPSELQQVLLNLVNNAVDVIDPS